MWEVSYGLAVQRLFEFTKPEGIKVERLTFYCAWNEFCCLQCIFRARRSFQKNSETITCFN